MSNDAAISNAARSHVAPYAQMNRVELMVECARLAHMLDAERAMVEELQNRLQEAKRTVHRP